MNKTAILAVKIISDARGVTSGFNKTSEAAGGVSKKSLAIKAGLLAGAAAVVKFGKDSIKTFTNVAGETSKLSRITGLGAEDASRLGFEMKMSGIDAQAGSKGLTMFAKNVVKMSESDKAGKIAAAAKANAIRLQIASLEKAGPKTANYAARMADLHKKLNMASTASHLNTSALGELGLKYTDAKGKVLPMADLLPKVADKFAKMPAGPERTALAMKLFGKQGADMLPFLTKGSAGLAELAAKSDAYGHTLTGSNLDALKQSKAAQRDWSAALEGVRIQFGAQLLPLLTAGATTLTSQLIPAITSTAKFLGENGQTVAIVVGALTGLLGVVKIVTTITRAWTAVQTVLNVVMAANPIGLIVLAIAALTAGFLYLWNTNAGFRDFFLNAWAGIQAAAAAVSSWFTGTFVPALSAVWNAIVAGVTWLWNAYVGAWVTIIKFALSIPGRIRAAVVGFVTVLVTAGRNLITGLHNGVTSAWTAVATWVAGIGNRIKAAIGNAATLLVNQGKAIIEGFWNGLKAMWDNVTGWISGIGKWIADHKGPLSYDRQLLVPAGVAIMGGLWRGLKSQMPALRSLVSTINATLGTIGVDAAVPTITVAGTGGTPSGAGVAPTIVNINISGALDPVGVARQVRDVLNGDARYAGRVALNGAVIV